MPAEMPLLDYDALIAGAGPAGCAAAYDLARAGKRVLLLEKRRFPRPKACACGLTRKTLQVLRYSVQPVIERYCEEIVLQPAHGHPPAGAQAVAVDRREVRLRARAAICAMAVRERFDAYCLQQTLAQGVEMLQIDSLQTLRHSDTHVTVEVATADGLRCLTALALIGADGANGQSRRLAATTHAGAPTPDRASTPSPQLASSPTPEPAWYERGFALEALVPYSALPATLPPTQPGGPPPDSHDLVFDFAPLPGGYGWLFPKGDHINIGVGAFAPAAGTDEAHLKRVTRALLTAYAAQKLGLVTLEEGSPSPGSSLPRGLAITGQHLGMGGDRYVPQGRVLLAGDAAGLVDPLTGEGIHSAVVSGQAAAAAVLSAGHADASTLAAAYAQRLRPLQRTLAFSRRAARAFYAEPERGFRLMRRPLVRSLVLKTYADGLPFTGAIAALARVFA